MKMNDNSIQAIAVTFIKTKNNTTFTTLVKRLKPGLLSYIRKYIKDRDICNEIVSQTFISIWEKIDQYNDKYNFSTWAYAIARNEALGYIRVQKKIYSHDLMTENHSKLLSLHSPVYNMDIECTLPEGTDLSTVLYDYVLDEIYKLKEPYKTVMEHREIQNLQLQEIANKLDWKLSTVKTRIRKARKDIEINIKRKYPELIESYYEI
jgi:RNA polymerase sigma-70 factor (ECF subfamily)